MKKLLIYTIFLILSTSVSAQVVFESSLEEAFEKAKKTNKLVFIEYYNSDCPVCIRLGDLLKKDPLVAAYYNENFINYAMNTNGSLANVDNAFITAVPLHFESVPVLLYFDMNKNFMHHSGVTVDSEHIINEGKKAKHPNYRSSGLQSRYENGERTINTLYAFAIYS